MLKEIRKELKIKPSELDEFINAKTTSTKYYLEDSFEENKLFRYLLLLKLRGANIDKIFSNYIKISNIKKPKKTKKPKK